MRVSPTARFDTTVAGQAISGLSVNVREDKTGAEREIWMAVDSCHAEHLSTRQDAFLPTLALYAMLVGEDLDCSGMRVDSFFLRNVTHATQQYGRWYPKLRVPNITQTTPAEAAPRGPKAAAFCSGGVDGSFTVLRHTAHNPGDVTRSLDTDVDFAFHVLYSPGLDGIAEHGAAGDALAAATEAWGVSLIKVYSNIYTFAPLQARNYAMMTHGAAFASLGHALSRHIGATLLASSHTDGFYHPYGSTPEVDPMYSSAAMKFINDGSHYARTEKVEFLCRNEHALRAMNVCDRRLPQADYRNCSHCHKCLRTMVAIDIYEMAGSACPAFDWSAYSPEAFGKVQLRGAGLGDEQCFAEELRDAAQGKRPDIVIAANRALARSRLFRPLFYVEDIAKKLPMGTGARESLKNIKRHMLSMLGAAR